jgi:cell cycle sensor histidine kinase DivJ
MITRHAPDGSVLFASAGSRRLCGARPGEMMGGGMLNRVQVADRPAYLRALSEALHAGAGSARFRLEARDESGQRRFIDAEMRCRISRDSESGEPVVIAVTRDVSEQMAREFDLAEAREQADQASRAKSAFLANMSHELRTPLNAIIGFSDILRSETLERLSGERRRDYARLIHAAGEHLLSVVNEVLDLSKIEAGKMELIRERVSLADIAASCCEIVQNAAEAKRIRLEIEAEDGLPGIDADPRACRQMMLNLLSNAIKFSHAGSAVTVSIAADHGFQRFSVSDTGIGIARADLPRLGEPFIQADSAYDRRAEGTGLGLALVKRLAELHGGAFALESDLGVGTVASVSLPRQGSVVVTMDRSGDQPFAATGGTGDQGNEELARERRRA